MNAGGILLAGLGAVVCLTGIIGCADERGSPPPFLPLSHCYPYEIYFGTGSSSLPEAAQKMLADAMPPRGGSCGINADPRLRLRVIVSGHADKVGTEAANEELSLRRAQNVARRLIDLGVPREYICIRAMGSRSPMVVQAEGAEPQHRRVTISHDIMTADQHSCPAGSVPPDAN